MNAIDMAAIALAIVGKNNEPLYVGEFLPEHQPIEDEAVLFGLKPLSGPQEVSTKCWFSLHAALDRLDQLTKTLDGKKKMITSGGDKNNNNFVGLLLPFEESRAYGYVTNTQTKIIIFIEDEGPNEADTMESETRQLLEEIHELYVREIMNPFHNYATSSTANKPVSASNKLSAKFNERIRKHVANFNQQ